MDRNIWWTVIEAKGWFRDIFFSEIEIQNSKGSLFWNHEKLAEGLVIHPASDSFEYLPKLYQRLHGSTIYKGTIFEISTYRNFLVNQKVSWTNWIVKLIKVSHENDFGILDQFGFLSQDSKINILFKVIHFRSFLLKIFGNWKLKNWSSFYFRDDKWVVIIKIRPYRPCRG